MCVVQCVLCNVCCVLERGASQERCLGAESSGYRQTQRGDGRRSALIHTGTEPAQRHGTLTHSHSARPV